MKHGESEDAGAGVPRALFLVVFGLALAVLWVIFGGSHSASAEEAPPPAPAAPAAAPSLLGTLASTVDSVVAAVPQQPVSAIVAPVTHTVDALVVAVPVVSQLTGPSPTTTILTPVTATVDSIVGPVLSDVVGPVVTGAAPDLPGALQHAGAAFGGTVISVESTTLSDIRSTDRGAGGAIGTWAPTTPSAPLDSSPADRSVGMLSGSSSSGGAASAGAAAGVVDAFTLPAPRMRGPVGPSADDSLPASLTLDPGSSPD